MDKETQVAEFDPQDHQQDPVRALTLVLRGLRMGQRVRLPDGTLVRSVAVKHGSSMERQFVIVPSDDSSTVLDRHRALALGRGASRTASEAAMKVLKGE